LFLVVLLPLGGAADEATLDETERWVPSFAITSGLIAQGGNATATNQAVDANGPTSFKTLSWSGACNSGGGLPPAGVEACPIVIDLPYPYDPEGNGPARGSKVLFAPLVGANLELMTPGLTQLPGRPRGFVQGGVEASFGFDYSVAKEGDLGDMGVTPKERVEELNRVPGRGSGTFVEIASPLYFAGAGVAFTAEVLGRRLRIKPSFEWMSQRVKVRGQTHFAVQLNGGIYATETPYQFLYLNAQKELKLNGIGPGLELELDTVRLGPFVLALGVYGRAYHYLGNLDVSFGTTGVGGQQSAVGVALPTINRETGAPGILATTQQCIDNVVINNAGTPPGQTGQNIGFGCRTVYPANLPNTLNPTTNPTQIGKCSVDLPPEDCPQNLAGTQTVETTYTYRQKPWSFRAGVALRFRFQPE